MSGSELFTRAVAAHQAGDFEAARRGYEACLPKLNAFINLATLHTHHGYHAEAERLLRLILSQRPDNVGVQHSLAHCLLADEQYEEGWRLYEARRPAGVTVVPQTATPEWMGGPAAGGRIVVCGEQGDGDQLQFARYLWELRRRGAEVVYATNRSLCPLLEREGMAVVPFSPAQPTIPDCDAWVMVGSLPLRLGLAQPLPPRRLGPPLVGGAGVGVVPTGSAAHANDAHRSLPQDQAARLLALGRDLRPSATGARSYLETAEILAGLDLVITVDTSVAHLAGSMGVPTWVLLPAFRTDFRWGRGRSDTPWYPSVTLYRQETPGSWGPLVDRVHQDLARELRPRRGEA